MKSKIFNTQCYTDYWDGIDRKYTNLFTSSATITPLTGNTFDANFPASNLHDNHVYKEAIVKPGALAANIGFTIDFNITDEISFDSVIIQFNKKNKNQWKYILSGDRSFQVIFEHKTDYTKNITLLFGTGTEYLYPDYMYLHKFSIKEGLILIDKDILSRSKVDDFKINEYNLIIMTSNLAVDEEYNYLSVSNIVVTNALDIKVDAKFNFERNNLSEITFNKKNGVSLVEKNEEVKEVKATVHFLSNTDQNIFDDYVRFFNNSPIYFFPYCENDEIFEVDFNYQITNLKVGGLYIMTTSFKLAFEEYSKYSTTLDLREYK